MIVGHDAILIALAAGAVILVVVLVAALKVHPFIALLIAALGLGIAGGADPAHVLKSAAQGFGDVAASVGIVLALGAMFGALLAHSRGAERIASALVDACGPRAMPWAMAAMAMVLGLPIFFETGVIILMPIIGAVAAKMPARPGRDNALAVGLPALAGLSVLHGLVPPHPGPMVAVGALHADVGRTLAIGLLIAVPTVAIAGPLFAAWASRHATAHLLSTGSPGEAAPARRSPGTAATALTVLFPIVLMIGKASADAAWPPQSRLVLDFIGTPAVALLLGTLLAMLNFGWAMGTPRAEIERVMGNALGPIAGVLLVICAGGAFKQTLVDLGLGATIGRITASWPHSPILIGWACAVMIRLATGSATIATITAAGLMTGAHGGDPVYTALAIGAGSLFFSHVNDAGFWMIKGFFGLSMADTFKTWSVLESLISVVGLLLILGASLLLP